MIRRAILVAAAAVALILTPSVAMAYDAPGFSSLVSDSTPSIGAPVTMTIQGGAANAGQVIKLVITSADSTKSMSKTANASGAAAFTFTLSAAGTYKVEAFNAAGALVSDQVLMVAASPAASGGPAGDQLASTGFDGMSLAVGGGVLVLAGAGAVVVARRRRSAQVPA
jgi:LPXTG-motif cell wall-anchored protein